MRYFAHLDFKGPDAAAFLQGYLTADVDALAKGTALPMAYCNLKGRVVASGWIAGEASHVRMLVHASVAADLAADLGKYLLFAKSKLTRAATFVSFAPDASAGAVALPPTGYFATFGAPVDAGHGAFMDACVETGFVAVAQPVSQAFLPQMIGLTGVGAVSFAKGCYLGQEVVARAEHRGQVKQQLRSYRFDAGCATPPTVGAEVVAAGRKVGAVVALGGGLALAATRADAAEVQVGQCRLTMIG